MSSQRAAQLVEAGIWLQVTGDVEGARRLFEQALRLDPENARARQQLSSLSSVKPTAPGGPVPLVQFANPFAPPPRGPPAPSPLPPLVAEEGAAAGDPWNPPSKIKELSPNAVSAWDTKSNPGVLLDLGRVGPYDPLDLVSAATPMPYSPSGARPTGALNRAEVEQLVRGAKDLLELDDHSGAMDLILKAQELAPDDREVKRLREKSEQTLQAMYESKLGPLDRVPRVVLKEDEIIWLNLDQRAGFMLAQIDGQVSYDDLFAISGMSRVDTARILAQLVEEGVIKT